MDDEIKNHEDDEIAEEEMETVEIAKGDTIEVVKQPEHDPNGWFGIFPKQWVMVAVVLAISTLLGSIGFGIKAQMENEKVMCKFLYAGEEYAVDNSNGTFNFTEFKLNDTYRQSFDTNPDNEDPEGDSLVAIQDERSEQVQVIP